MRYFTDKVNLQGRVAIVTGANSGIGFETAKFLFLNGATVVLGCRNVDRGESARKQMLDEYQKRNTTQESDSPDLTDVEKRLLLRTIDLSSLKSVRDFAEGLEREGALTRLDLLILNAAEIGPKERKVTEDGLEVTMATNYFGHFLLASLLLPHLKRTAETARASGSPAPRLVCVSSGGYSGVPLFYKPKLDIDDLNKPGAYGSIKALMLSKLAVMLFVFEVRKRLAGAGVVGFALNPGAVDTAGFRSNVPAVMRFLMRPILRVRTSPPPVAFALEELCSRVVKTPWQGCQTTLYCALSSALEPASQDAPQPALYFDDCAPASTRDTATDERVAALLWAASERYTGLAK